MQSNQGPEYFCSLLIKMRRPFPMSAPTPSVIPVGHIIGEGKCVIPAGRPHIVNAFRDFFRAPIDPNAACPPKSVTRTAPPTVVKGLLQSPVSVTLTGGQVFRGGLQAVASPR